MTNSATPVDWDLADYLDFLDTRAETARLMARDAGSGIQVLSWLRDPDTDTAMQAQLHRLRGLQAVFAEIAARFAALLTEARDTRAPEDGRLRAIPGDVQYELQRLRRNVADYRFALFEAELQCHTADAAR